MATDWKDYQDDVAMFFRSIGLDAQTNVTVEGVRTKHDVDVLVKSQHVGFDATWIVECKLWTSKVSKIHVLGLRQIVIDVGADRGIILPESGFQSGAVEAASLTNVHVTSLANLRATASSEIFSMRLRELFDRVEICEEKYWSIPKPERIRYGLRQDLMVSGYSGREVIELSKDLLRKAFRGTYPIEPDELMSFKEYVPQSFDSIEALLGALEPLIEDLDEKLKKYFHLTNRPKVSQ